MRRAGVSQNGGFRDDQTIVAIATGRGGAISVVRVDGPDAIAVVDSVFVPRGGRQLIDAAGYTVHFGDIVEGISSPSDAATSRQIVDEVLVTVFRAPHSYTSGDGVEISCHASPYIESKIIELLIAAGASEHGPRVRIAGPGEFTTRAFLAGKLDLSQAEAVADLIAAEDRAGHSLAMGQMRGGVSGALAGLRAELVGLAALLELELDFGEEDVEFASRERLRGLTEGIATEIDKLIGSFALGNAIRTGIPVAIVGRPNAGKSTLLNALVGDDRAMVSDIAGTTRDRIEERVNIGGVGFRFIDTAGLRETSDVLEQMGIDRALEAASRAAVVLLVVDAASDVAALDVAAQPELLDLRDDQRLCVVLNKIDRHAAGEAMCSLQASMPAGVEIMAISAKTGRGLDALRDWLVGTVDFSVAGTGSGVGSAAGVGLGMGSTVVSNARHHEALVHARQAVGRVLAGLSGGAKGDSVQTLMHGSPTWHGVSADLLAEDIREVLHHLGSITGEVTSDEILGTIFSRFCIGK